MSTFVKKSIKSFSTYSIMPNIAGKGHHISLWLLFPRIFVLAIKALWVFKARTIFILLAVALGVGSLTIITAAMEGAEKMAEKMAVAASINLWEIVLVL